LIVSDDDHTPLSPVILHLSSFFLILPRPPTPTLLPYTTLFRSGPTRGRSFIALSPSPSRVVTPRPACPADRPCHARSAGQAGRGDRKSTRLNSSHVAISYAVFCLKKKKKRSPAVLYPSYTQL